MVDSFSQSLTSFRPVTSSNFVDQQKFVQKACEANTLIDSFFSIGANQE